MRAPLDWLIGLGLLLGCAAAVASPPAERARRIAVLETIAPSDVAPQQAMAWTDQVRGAARRRLGAGYLLLTRQNIEALLPPGVDLADCEGDCEVDTGRNVGADYVLTVRVEGPPMDRRVRVSCLATADARLVGVGRSAASPMDVAIAQATAAALAPLEPLDAPPVAPPAPSVMAVAVTPDRGVPPGKVRFASPHGVLVRIGDEQPRPTPFTVSASRLAQAELVASADGYQRARLRLTGLGRAGGQVAIALQRSDGLVRFDRLPDVAAVFLEGALVNARSVRLAPGAYRFSVRHACFDPAPLMVRVAAGDVLMPGFTERIACARVDLETNVVGARADGGGLRGVLLPHALTGAPGSQHTIEVAYPGHHPVKRTIRLPATIGGARVERFELRPIEADVTVTGRNRVGAACTGVLLVDGVPRGRLPWRGRLPVGQRLLSVRCPRLIERTVQLVEGEQAVVIQGSGLVLELGVRSDARSGGAIWGAERFYFAGPVHLRLGFGVGGTVFEPEPTTHFIVQPGLGINLASWLDLTINPSLRVEPKECPAGTPADESCDRAWWGGNVGARAGVGPVYLEATYGMEWSEGERVHGALFGLGLQLDLSRGRNK